jgi:hypothetical protein
MAGGHIQITDLSKLYGDVLTNTSDSEEVLSHQLEGAADA